MDTPNEYLHPYHYRVLLHLYHTDYPRQTAETPPDPHEKFFQYIQYNHISDPITVSTIFDTINLTFESSASAVVRYLPE